MRDSQVYLSSEKTSYLSGFTSVGRVLLRFDCRVAPHIGCACLCDGKGEKEMELKDKDDVGSFVSYNEKTGRGTIFPGTHDEYVRIKDILAGKIRSPYPEPPLDPDGRCFFFLIPESQKHQFNFKVGRSVVCDLVKKGSMEVTNLRF